MKTSHAIASMPVNRSAHPRAGAGHDRRGHHRPGARGRRRRHDFRLQRRRDPADLRRGVPLQRRAVARRRRAADAADRARRTSRARASWPRVTRARAAASASCIVTSGPGATNTVTPVRDCMADSIPDRRDLRPGADEPRSAPTRSRKRRSPTSWASVAKHVFLVTDADEARGDDAHGVRDRAHRPARPGRHRRAEGRAELAGRLPGRRPRCRSRGYRSAHRDASSTDIADGTARQQFFAMLGEAQRPLIYAGGGVINGDAARRAARVRATRSASRSSTTLMGIGAFDTTQPLSHAHARHARRGVRELRGRRLRFPDRARRALRRPRRGQCRRSSRRARSASRTSTSTRPRSTRSSACSGATSGLLARGAARAAPRTASARASSATRSQWHAHLAELKQTLRDELRPRQRADPAVLRDRGDQPASRRARRSSRPASASTRCGPRSTSTSASRACGSRRAAWARWASACRPRSARSSRSRDKLVIDIDGDA